MLKTGLVSATFRRLPATEVIRLAAAAGLDGIEWSGDRHVPAGDLQIAEVVGRQTREAGLAVLSYGSYYRAEAAEEQAAVLDTARALGAPHLRVWAGTRGSAAASPAERAAVVEQLQRLRRRAGKLPVSVEYHRDTLADTPEAALALVREVGGENFHSYFQPRPGGDNVAALRLLAPAVSNLHVYCRAPDGARRPLAEGKDEWRRCLRLLNGRLRALLLEFVMDDSPEQFLADAACLKRWVEPIWEDAI